MGEIIKLHPKRDIPTIEIAPNVTVIVMVDDIIHAQISSQAPSTRLPKSPATLDIVLKALNSAYYALSTG